jgi:nucleotide-binding universal stress UspA family protein
VFRRILVGFDGSTNSLVALRAALQMAATASGEATVLIVIPDPHGETEEDRIASFEADARPLQTMAQRELDTRPKSEAVVTLHVVSAGNPARALLAFAESHGYDLLVVGRHGQERATHGGLGRVARELADSAPFPLLLVGDGEAWAEP